MTGDRHILVTGGAGYIGSLLTSELLRNNFRVTVIDSLLFGGETLGHHTDDVLQTLFLKLT